MLSTQPYSNTLCVLKFHFPCLCHCGPRLPTTTLEFNETLSLHKHLQMLQQSGQSHLHQRSIAAKSSFLSATTPKRINQSHTSGQPCTAQDRSVLCEYLCRRYSVIWARYLAVSKAHTVHSNRNSSCTCNLCLWPIACGLPPEQNPASPRTYRHTILSAVIHDYTQTAGRNIFKQSFKLSTFRLHRP